MNLVLMLVFFKGIVHLQNGKNSENVCFRCTVYVMILVIL